MNSFKTVVTPSVRLSVVIVTLPVRVMSTSKFYQSSEMRCFAIFFWMWFEPLSDFHQSSDVDISALPRRHRLLSDAPAFQPSASELFRSLVLPGRETLPQDVTSAPSLSVFWGNA